MNKKIIIVIVMLIIIASIVGILAWKKVESNNEPEPNEPEPIISTPLVAEDYANIMYNNKEYVPYAMVLSAEKGEYLGTIRTEEIEEIYTLKNYSQDEWIITCSDDECVLYKEKNVTNIPEELISK